MASPKQLGGGAALGLWGLGGSASFLGAYTFAGNVYFQSGQGIESGHRIEDFDSLRALAVVLGPHDQIVSPSNRPVMKQLEKIAPDSRADAA